MQFSIITRAILLPLSLLLLSFYGFAQPAGANQYNPINAGALTYGSPYLDTQNNDPNNGFGNETGHYSDDIYYQFTLNYAAEINISHCASGFDTYLHVLDANGNEIAAVDDNGPLCAGLQASLSLQLEAGTYYAVSEGYSGNYGYISTEINLLTPPPVLTAGANMNNPFDAGVLNYGAPYASTQNNDPANGFGNDLGQYSDDIYYRFTLNYAGDVHISHCGSDLDTYLHVLDANGNEITAIDDNGPLCAALQASLSLHLAPGTYYAVSEGFSGHYGDITTQLTLLTPPPAVPAGASFSCPVQAGAIPGGTAYTDTKNNNSANGFGNEYGQYSDDIYYKFSIDNAAEVSIAHCSSGFDTYLHLLDAAGNLIASNDDSGPVCPGTLQASLKRRLDAGTYYAVSEGYGFNSGNITTVISVAEDAEGETPDGFYTKMTRVFEHVDRAPVTAGILMDAGIEFAGMNHFTGTAALTDSNYVSTTVWRSVYGSLESAKFNSQVNFSPFAAINASVKNALADTLPVPFMVLNYNYQTFREDAVNAGLISIQNEQLFDVPGRTESPYQLKTAFAIAPAKESIAAPGGFASFIFKPELMFGNTGKTLSQLQADLGDGAGWRTAALGTAFTVHYAESGIKDVKYQFTYTDNSVYTGHSKVYIQYQNENETPGGNSNMFFHPIGDQRISALSGTKSATLQIRLSNQNSTNVIKKPLIVAEGIDFWRITSPDEIRSNTTIEDFIDGTDIRLFPNNNLRDSIDLLSYDIIYIDFDDATDYLENNAALVQAAIAKVNELKQPNASGVKEQNVVLGLSMGGVLARHALRSMELNGVPHDTKLYISMDSPHQGANFPLSLQAFVKHLNNVKIKIMGSEIKSLKDQYPALEMGKAVLDAPACRQLLKYRIGDDDDLGIDNSAHDSFYSNYHAMGMPSCRTVAVSNGSQCGTAQPFEPLRTIFELRSDDALADGGWQALINLADFVTSPMQIFLGAGTSRPFIGFGSLLGLFSTRTSFYVDFEAKTLADQGHSRIYHGRAGIRRRILWSFNVNSNITNRSAYSASYMLPLDNAPGGVAAFASGAGLNLPAELAEAVNIPGFCFVPTVSAIDMGNGASLSAVQLMAGYSSANTSGSPFSTFVTSTNNNEEHFTFTQRNGAAVLKELKDITSSPTDCSFICGQNLAITGRNSFCSAVSLGTNLTIPSGSTIQWGVTGPFTIQGASNALSVTVQPASGGDGQVFVRISNNCGEREVSYTINSTINNVPRPAEIIGDDAICLNTEKIYSIPGLPGISNHWSVEGNLQIVTAGESSIRLKGIYGAEHIGVLSVYATNECGHASILRQKTIRIPACAPGPDRPHRSISETSDELVLTGTLSTSQYNSDSKHLAIYPNPVSSELTISLPKVNGEGGKGIIKLFDQQGKQVRRLKYSEKDNLISLDVKDLPDGIYYLQTVSPQETLKQQLIIKH